jgi:hypothetical protein
MKSEKEKKLSKLTKNSGFSAPQIVGQRIESAMVFL